MKNTLLIIHTNNRKSKNLAKQPGFFLQKNQTSISVRL